MPVSGYYEYTNTFIIKREICKHFFGQVYFSTSKKFGMDIEFCSSISKSADKN